MWTGQAVHALVSEPRPGEEDQYRSFWQLAQIKGIFPDGLVGGHPYAALNAVVLSQADWTALRDLTDTFCRVLMKAARALARDVPHLIEMGFPWMAAEILAAEPPRTPIVGRFDFVQDPTGHWWVLEFNADTPSGVREAIVLDGMVHRTLGRASRVERANQHTGRLLVQAFRRALRSLPIGGRLGLVTTAGELEDLAQMAFTRALLARGLARWHIDVVLGDIDNLKHDRGGLLVAGQRIDAVYRYVPYEGMLGTAAFTAIAEAGARGSTLLLNGLFGLLLQNKALLAWVWEHRDDRVFSAPERAVIAAHLPPTWMMDDAPEPASGESLVAKQLFGREGEEVFFSEDLSQADWDRLGGWRTYVAQRRVEVSTFDAVVPTATGPTRAEVRASVGSFAIDGRWGGFYTRVGGKVITSRAKWLATFVER